MPVTCPNCGGPHPKWECKKPIAKKSWNETIQELNKGFPKSLGLDKAVKKVVKSLNAQEKPKPEVCPTCGQVSHNEYTKLKMREYRGRKKAEKEGKSDQNP